MIASKVSISHETRAKLRDPVLDSKKRRRLKEQLIKEYIRNAPKGECSKQELIAAAGYSPQTGTSNYVSGLNFLNRMISNGVVSHNDTTRNRKIWTVTEDRAKIPVKPEKFTEPSRLFVEPVLNEVDTFIGNTEHAQHAPTEFEAVSEPTTLTRQSLVDMAKQFAWKYNSDSLREFIKNVEENIQ